MTNFIILSCSDILSLFNNKPVEVYVDHTPYVLCTDKYYEDTIKNENTDMMDGQDESNYIKDMDLVNDKLKDLSKRVENIENQIKKDKEEQLKKTQAEIEHAKFCCALSEMARIPRIK